MKSVKIKVMKKLPWVYKGFRFRKIDEFIIDDFSWMKTERDLCKYIYDKFGEGRYMCHGYCKGIKGFWAFWLGDLYSTGFQRDLTKNKEVEQLKGQMARADSFEERESLEEDIGFIKEITQEEKKAHRRGPSGFLITSRPGVMHSYIVEEEIRQ